jgi:hypothetical protein
VTTFYFAGGEDLDFQTVGNVTVNTTTTAAFLRSSYSRCSMQVGSCGGSTIFPHNFQVANGLGSLSTFWATGRVGHGGSTTSFTTNAIAFRFVDASNITRIQIIAASSNTYQAQKITAAGATTNLGSAFSYTGQTTATDKFDFYINYAVSGSLIIYINGIQVLNYSGDVTTDGNTTLSNFKIGNANLSIVAYWSEVIVSDTDTRAMSLVTLVPAANGNTHNFDTGSPAASNINETTINDSTLDGSSVAGQIDEYTINGLPSGTFSILAVGMSVRAQRGTVAGPTKMDMVLRQSGTDYFSSDISLTTGFTGYQNFWLTDPSTSSAWASLPINIGIKSVA